MEKNKILITNIQRFSLHDGPGIRTTVFTKGCSLSCPWCSNPENMKMHQEPYVKDGIKGIYGRYLSCDEIYDELIKDKVFYGTWDKRFISMQELKRLPGGVTFSGGEALLWADKLQYLWQKLKDDHIHMAVETSLSVPTQSVELASEYMDLFYVDIKILETERCKAIIKGDLKKYFSNLEYLFLINVPIIFRIPVIGGYTDSKRNRDMVVDVIKTYRPLKVELIKGHNLGNSKYKSLGKAVLEYHEVSDNFLEEYQQMIQELEIETEICRIING